VAILGSGRAFTKCRRVQFRSKKPVWTAKAVGRVACYARSSGATHDDLLKFLAECAPCKEQRQRRNSQRLQAALQANNALINDTELILTGLNLAIEGFLLLSRFVPMLKAASIPVTLARRPVAALVTRLRSRKAANDELYELVRREDAA